MRSTGTNAGVSGIEQVATVFSKPSLQSLLLNTCPSGYIAQASSSTAIQEAFRFWPHNPLASPRLFTHHTGRYHTLSWRCQLGWYEPRWSARMTYKEFAETASSAQVRYYNNYVTRLIAERR